MTAINEKLLDERLAALESARAWSPRVVSKLESHIRSADDAGLLRINPLAFAAEKGLAEEEAIDLFLHASSLGLFDMNWILICPICSCVIDSFRALKNLQSHCRCTNCHVDLVAALDDMIAVTFTVNPAIRRIAYHDPETLPVEDYVFRYRSAEEGLVPDGTPFVRIKEMINQGAGLYLTRRDGHDGSRRRGGSAARHRARLRRRLSVHHRSGAPACGTAHRDPLRRERLRRRRVAPLRPARSPSIVTSTAAKRFAFESSRACRRASTARRRCTLRRSSPASGF